MPELVHLRTRFSKTHDNGDGTRTVEASVVPIHYDDGQGGMAEITREFVPSDRPGYDWMSGDNDFRMHFKENLNQADSMLFIRGGIEVASRPKGVVLHRSDTGAHTVLGTPSDTTCVVDGKNITFFGLYPHCQVRYQNLGDGVKEFIRMTSFNGIPDPLDYGINPEVVRVGFVTELNPSGHDSMDDGADGSIVENTDYDQISFKKGDVRPIFIPVLAAWSEAWDRPRPRTVTKRMKMIGGKPHLIHGLKYGDLVSRSLPYIIDASFVGNPAVAADDGSSTSINQFFNAGTVHYMGRDVPSKDPAYSEYCFFRFPTVTIPQGSTINSATFGVFRTGRVGVAQNCRLFFNDEDNAAAPVSKATHDSKIRTLAYTAFTVGGSSTTGYRYISAVSPMQEVVDRAGWSSGNAMMVLSDYYGGTALGFDAWRTAEYPGTSTDPVLTVNYTEPSSNLSVNDVSLDTDVTPAGIYGPLTANNVTVGLSTTSATLVEAGGSLALNDVTIDTAVTSAAISFSGATLSVLSVVAGPTTTPATLIGWLEANGVSLGADITPVMLTGWFTANNVTLAPTATTAEIVGWLATNNVTLSPTTTEADLIGLLTANDVTLPPTVTPAEIVGWLSANNVTLSPTVTEADIVGWLTNNDVTLDTTATPATLNLAGDLNVIDITLDLSASSATLVGVGWSNRIDSVLAASVDSVPVANILKINGV